MTTPRNILGRLSQMDHLPVLSSLSPSSSRIINENELASFKKAQKLAYDCTLAISLELRDGWSEQETAKLMDTWLQDHGVRTFFHKSFAWFGDRTRFHGFKHYLNFLPSKRVLTPNDIIILDTAPIVNGYAGDVGYSYCLTQNPDFDCAMSLLRLLRDEIPSYFKDETISASKIWKIIDNKIRTHGFDNCHQKYPFAVLGHRLHKIPLSTLPGLTIPFTLHSYWALLSRGLFPELLTPTHAGSKIGIWAIEPHIGGTGFGAKFEEILVVTPTQAYWLDNSVPHVLPVTKKGSL